MNKQPKWDYIKKMRHLIRSKCFPCFKCCNYLITWGQSKLTRGNLVIKITKYGQLLLRHLHFTSPTSKVLHIFPTEMCFHIRAVLSALSFYISPHLLSTQQPPTLHPNKLLFIFAENKLLNFIRRYGPILQKIAGSAASSAPLPGMSLNLPQIKSVI